MVTTSRILGPDGQPIRIADLAEPQTSQVRQLHREWQGHPGRGLTPSRLASLLLDAEQGDIVAQYELFEDMEERDGHILAEMGKRRRAVSGLAFDIVPPPNATAAEKAEAEAVKALMEQIDDIESVLFDVTDAIGKGFACLELEWHRLDGDFLPKAIEHRPQSWFRLHRGQMTQEIRLRDHSADGAQLQAFGWIQHRHKARSGYLERANLFRALVWPYLFKNYSVADLAEFLEIYGIPLRLGKFPPGSSPKEKATLLRALVELGHNAAGIVPSGMELELHAAAQGDPAAFQLMMDWCERTQSKVILGATLTSQADRGSNTNALGNVHNEVRKELRDADSRLVEATVSRDLVYPIAVLNGLARGGFRRAPRLVFDRSETRDLKSFADALPPLVSMGVQVPVDWVHTELGIPRPEAGVPVLRAAPAAEPPPADPAEQAAARAVLAARVPDPAIGMAQQLGGRVDLAPWIDSIRAEADRATSLEDLRERLVELSIDMSLDQYAAALREALTAAALAGSVEALRSRDEP